MSGGAGWASAVPTRRRLPGWSRASALGVWPPWFAALQGGGTCAHPGWCQEEREGYPAQSRAALLLHRFPVLVAGPCFPGIFSKSPWEVGVGSDGVRGRKKLKLTPFCPVLIRTASGLSGFNSLRVEFLVLQVLRKNAIFKHLQHKISMNICISICSAPTSSSARFAVFPPAFKPPPPSCVSLVRNIYT